MKYPNLISRSELIDKIWVTADIIPLILTVYGEARGEGMIGMRAVTHVILNRVRKQRTKWGTNIKEVCLKKKQFSYWNKHELHDARPKIRDFFDAGLAVFRGLHEYIYEGVDLTNGATHYYNPRRVKRKPPWSIGKEPCEVIKNHKFYNDVA